MTGVLRGDQDRDTEEVAIDKPGREAAEKPRPLASRIQKTSSRWVSHQAVVPCYGKRTHRSTENYFLPKGIGNHSG